MNKLQLVLKWAGRVLAWILIGVILLAIAGAIYQALATAADRRAYPAPGQLVDVGGHRLHVACTGQGSPTVILEAAADMMSADWGWIQPEIARQTRVCSYDRAGMGWSEAGPQPRDASQVSAELHSLLAKAAIDGPYILVGHSAGGLYVRIFADQYPQEVVGLVLVDPGHPDMEVRIPALAAQNQGDGRLVRTLQLLSYLGIPRLLGVGKSNAAGLPPQQAAEVNASISRPGHWATLLALMQATPASYAEVRDTGSLDARPLVVLSAGTAWFERGAPPDEARRIINELHDELTALSTNSSHRVVEGATHGSLVHDQDDAQAVIVAIEDVLSATRTGQAAALGGD